MRKRARDRRRSIVQASPLTSLTDSQDYQAIPTDEDTAGSAQEVAPGTEEGVASSGRSKRRRSAQESSPVPDTPAASSQTTRRRSRRQSMVGVVDISLTDDSEEKDDPESSSAPLPTRKSPRRRQSTTPTRSSGKKGTEVCELCYSEDAVVHMKPCNHSVCGTCWTRLAPALSLSSGEVGETRMCPWDRELVTKR